MVIPKRYNDSVNKSGQQAAVMQQASRSFVCTFLSLHPAHETKGAGDKRERGDGMKEWAKDFYNSTAWRETREAYLVSQQYVCERCEEPATMVHHKTWLTRHNITRPELTLCWDNLEALCQDCHNKEHHKTKRHGRYKFDADGNVVEG